jgi:diguanylate cyclase (GGDEF)-like protein/PAS domain S-box-containing protein
MTLQSNIFRTYTLFLLVPLFAVMGGGGYLAATAMRQGLEQEAAAGATAVRQMTETAVEAALVQTLRTVAERNLTLLHTLQQKSQSGALTLDEAQWLALDALAAQGGGQQGQLFCINQQGIILSHPNKALVNTPLAGDLLTRLQQLQPLSHGEYAGLDQQPSVLYRADFPAWNWTLVITCSQNEQRSLLPLAVIAKKIGETRFADGRHPFLLDQSDLFWAPPVDAREAATDRADLINLADLAAALRRDKTGRILWTPQDRPKEEQTLFFHQLPHYGLIVGIAAPSAALAKPITLFQRGVLFGLLPLAALSLALVSLLARRLSDPLRQLADELAAIDEHHAEPIRSCADTEELTAIAAQYNRLLTTFQEHHRRLLAEQTANEHIQRQLRLEIAGRTETQHKLAAENATRKSAENYLLLFKGVFDNAIEGIYITDPEARILTVNQSFAKITGYQPAEVIGHNPSMLGAGRRGQDFYQGLWQGLRSSGSWSGEIWNQKKDGTVCPQWLSISVIKNEQQQITHYFAFFHDITELKRKEKQISIMAYSDALTKLPNRAALEHRLGQAIARASRDRLTLAVFFIDLDNFKNINDSLGHDKGDQVLIEVAARLSKTIRSEDTLSRLGGDEFILLSESIENEQSIYNLATRILTALKEPIALSPNTIYINASIGVSIYPEDGKTTQELIKNADMAMYKAKSEGKNKFVMFTREMNEKLLNRIRTESAIRTGLKQREFTVFYQPKIDLADDQITSFEALIRWRKNGALIGPDSFIPIAEESGLIDEMSLYVLDEVCIFLDRMQRQNFRTLPISVNMSPRTFNNLHIVETIDAILAKHRIDHQLIEFEITETTAMKDVQHTLAVMQRFRQRGIRFSIDDFGTGYSSLSYLSEMPVSTLKIDKRFISADDANSRSIVSTITAMSKQMQLKVVAEGVETLPQLQWLRGIGCNEVQGFYFSRPMPDQDALRYMQSPIIAALPQDASHHALVH